MPALIDPAPAIAVLEHHGWELQDVPFYDENGKEDRLVIPMITPEGEAAAVLFKARDSNQASNHKYGLPVDRLWGVEYVMLWALDKRNRALSGDFLERL